MNNSFNLSWYSELIEKETALANKEKSLFYENKSDYLEILYYEASVQQQITYSRRNDYFLLINQYLNQLITPSKFRNEFLNMEKQDGTRAKEILQDFQQLEFFSLFENLEEFSNLMGQISDLCEGENEFYNSVNNLYSQIKKSFED